MRERWWAANPRTGQADPDDPAGSRPGRTGFRGRLSRLVFAGSAEIRCAA